MRAPSLVRAQLAAANLSEGVHLRRDVVRLHRAGETWQALDPGGAIIASAPVAILANGHDALRLADCGPQAAHSIRGQLSYLRTPPFAAPRCVVGGEGYVLPVSDGIAVVGASFDRDNMNPQPDTGSRDDNLARAESLMPGCTRNIDASAVDGAVAFRCATTDRLPMIGPIADAAAARANATALTGARPHDLPRTPGLYAAFAYGSRGLVWAALAAEALACELDGEPAPLERSLLDAVDPGRFVMKHLRRGTL
jgi:tRNA 5-methylaminomethyl-2-thiouridine biosynthesis bifunctional protein